MKIKIVVIGLILSLTSSLAMAVDGYKDVKFGSSIKEVLDKKWCNWTAYKNSKPSGLQGYYCTDFKFSGQPTLAIAIFIDGKFERLSIILNRDITPVISALQKKYGPQSSSSSKEDSTKAIEHGGEIYIKFDNDTVFVSVNRDVKTQKDTSSLVYTSQNYDNLYAKTQEKELEGEL